MDLLRRMLRRVTIDNGHPEAMTTGSGLCSKPLQVTVFIDGLIGFGHG
jgi:hypothetical protein